MIHLSVVLPTYNRLDRLRRVLHALESQTYPADKFEVLVISDGSTDGTDTYLQSVETALHLRPLSQPNQGPAQARNQGVASAVGSIILFIDDDVVPAPQLITEHLSMHQNYGDQLVVIGPMLSPPRFQMAPWVAWEQDQLAKQYGDMQAGQWQPTARQFYTGNSSVARHHVIEAGGFDPAFRRAEDVELAYRLKDRGLRFVFLDDNPLCLWSERCAFHKIERSELAAADHLARVSRPPPAGQGGDQNVPGSTALKRRCHPRPETLGSAQPQGAAHQRLGDVLQRDFQPALLSGCGRSAWRS